jgi:hypothetical protein
MSRLSLNSVPLFACLFAGVALAPDVAFANPGSSSGFSRSLRWIEPPASEGAGATDPASEPTAEPAAEPTSEPAEPEGPTDDTSSAIEDGDTTADASLEGRVDEGAPKENGPNRHAIGVRGGITVVPSWFLSPYVASQANSLCRNSPGDWALERGLTKTQGCNFYIAAEYIYRKSEILDIVPSIGYQRLALPDGMFLDKEECPNGDGPDCNLDAADYTEIDLSYVSIQSDFIWRKTLVKTPDFQFALGGGFGIGMGVKLGAGVFQTPMGPTTTLDPTRSCRTIADLADFRQCTPAWFDDDEIDQDGDGFDVGDVPPTQGDLTTDQPNPLLYANCTRDNCNTNDLRAFGSREKVNWIPPVLPVVNLIVSARFLVKETMGIQINGGFNWGFYFGASVNYHFGGWKK